ncbi:hypothetical protein KXX21_006057 [Aspergillus fumigatus]|nr:hypothetical protein KXX21_006057 [Aspergillus fumigatus]
MVLLLFAGLMLLELARAQVKYDPASDTLICTKPGGRYCPEGSLKGSTIISCVSTTMIEVRSCNTMYSSPSPFQKETTHRISRLSRSIPPLYSSAAVRHESSKHAGDAVCAFNGTGYSIDGKISHIPDTTLCGSWELPLFVFGRNCDEGDTPFQTRAGIDRVHVSEPPRVREGANALLPSPASFNGRVCSLPYNPWKLGECVDGTAMTAVPVLQVIISDGYGPSPSRTSSITPVSSAVSGVSPASGWPVSSSGATATGAANVGYGRGLLRDGAWWSMLLLISLRVVAHVLLVLGWA